VRKGALITLEGIDYSGKSTQADILVKRLRDHGVDAILIREPGGTDLSERIRNILLSRREIEINHRAELFLFLAARAQLVDSELRPTLDSGRVVICDRFFDSTIAYQGYARGIPVDLVRTMNSFATEDLDPDLTLLYDLPVDVARKRGHNSNNAPDRLEREEREFHQKVRDGYLALAAEHSDRIKVIDAAVDVDSISAETWELTLHLLERQGIALQE
jgi:dTMP kinase